MKKLKEKLSKKLKDKAKIQKEDNPSKNKATAEIVASLLGSKSKLKSSVGLRLNSTKSVTKKCSDKEVKTKTEKKTVTPYIFIQDNLLRASLYADLNALHLDTKNNDNCIDFDAAVCLKFCEKGIDFYIEASENPMPEVLEEEGKSCFVKRFRPKGAYPSLQAMLVNGKGKTVYESSITYPQLLKIVERGLSKLIRVSGNLTLPQVQTLKLNHVAGKHFSYYSK